MESGRPEIGQRRLKGFPVYTGQIFQSLFLAVSRPSPLIPSCVSSTRVTLFLRQERTYVTRRPVPIRSNINRRNVRCDSRQTTRRETFVQKRRIKRKESRRESREESIDIDASRRGFLVSGIV